MKCNGKWYFDVDNGDGGDNGDNGDGGDNGEARKL